MECAVELVRKQDVLNLCELYMNHYYSLSREGIIEKLRADVHNLAVAQKICDKCGRICFGKESFCPACGENLRKEPATVGAVEVVRCKDCKYCGRGTDEDGKPFLKCLEWAYGGKKPNDFCSYGERKDNGNA